MTTPVAMDEPEIEGHYAPLGDYTVSFESFKQDVDPAPYFVGLPQDRPPVGYGSSGPMAQPCPSPPAGSGCATSMRK
jgi:hypothetical protein